MIKIWLMLYLLMPGKEPVTIADIEMPDVKTCIAALDKELTNVASILPRHPGSVGFQARCQIEKEEDHPA